MGEARTKGRLLENVVRDLYLVTGAEVEVRTKRKVRWPTQNRTRELDVVLTTMLADEPVETVVTCKNLKGKIGIDKIDSFIGALDDIGVPTERGVFVSPIGFTKGALGRAEARNIQTLVASGLTPDRLQKAIMRAVQSQVFIVPRWDTFSGPFPNHGDGPGLTINIKNLEQIPKLANQFGTEMIWRCWVENIIPSTLGKYTLSFTTKKNILIATVDVFAVCRSVEGSGSITALTHAKEEQIETMRIDADFPDSILNKETLIFQKESDLKRLHDSSEIRLIHRVRLPKIMHEKFWYPPSKSAIEKLRQNSSLGFDDVEGRSINKAFDP